MEKTPRKIIYEFQEYGLKDIFKKLVKEIEDGSLKFPWHPKGWEEAKWQRKMIEFFKRLGESAGYKVYGDQEWFKIDCPWVINLPDHPALELLMEFQDSSDVDDVLGDIIKIGCFKAAKKVIIYFPTFNDLPNHLEKISKTIQDTNKEITQVPEEKWLVVTITNQPEGKVTFRGYEFDAKGKYELIGEREFNEDLIKE